MDLYCRSSSPFLSDSQGESTRSKNTGAGWGSGSGSTGWDGSRITSPGSSLSDDLTAIIAKPGI